MLDVATGKTLQQFDGLQRGSVGLTFSVGNFGNPAPTLAFSPDSKTLLAGGLTNSLALWDVATGKELQQVSGHTAPLLGLFLTPDGKTLLTATPTARWALDAGPARNLAAFA